MMTFSLAFGALSALAMTAQADDMAAKDAPTELKVCVAELQPWIYVDDEAPLRGFEVDALEGMAEELNLKTSFIVKNFEELRPALIAGECDMIASGFSITFDQPILGLIVGGDWADASLFRTTLDDSDFLGANASYTKNSDLRRRGSLEGSSAEFLTISADGYTLTGALHATGVHVDNVRIITESAIIPTPGATALLGLAGLLMYRRRRA